MTKAFVEKEFGVLLKTLGFLGDAFYSAMGKKAFDVSGSCLTTS